MIGLLIFGGAEIAMILALIEAWNTPGCMPAFHFGLWVFIPYNLFFALLTILHFIPAWWQNGTNEKPCDPNWTPVDWKK